MLHLVITLNKTNDIMKNTTLFLTFILASFMFNITEASFPVTKKIATEQTDSTVATDLEKPTLSKKIKNYFAGLDWGAFFLGFLLGILGVLIVYMIGGDSSSAWKGFGVWILILVALILATTAAVGSSTYYY